MAHIHADIFSSALGQCAALEVILPQGSGKETYPVLYLLHGLSDDQSCWLRRTSIERYAEERGIAVVMPDADVSFYTDMKYGKNYWTYVSEELPAICRDLFPRISQKREDTFAAGLSMGGYGAFKLGLRNPQRFAAVASLSGALDMVALVGRKEIQPPEFWNNIFGSPEELAGSDNDLFALARKIKSGDCPQLFACCGTSDFLYGDNQNALACFRAQGLPITYEEGEGVHNWIFWDRWIQRILQWLPVR